MSDMPKTMHLEQAAQMVQDQIPEITGYNITPGHLNVRYPSKWVGQAITFSFTRAGDDWEYSVPISMTEDITEVSSDSVTGMIAHLRSVVMDANT